MKRRRFDTAIRPASATLLVLVGCLAFSAPLWAAGQARLSKGVSDHLASKSRASIDLIVRGTADEVEALAARHGVTIARRLKSGAVLRANATEIAALSDDPAIGSLSRDVQVTSFMAVTDPAIGADQVWDGVAGLPGLVGRGVGVALIDSGIWAQRAISRRAPSPT